MVRAFPVSYWLTFKFIGLQTLNLVLLISVYFWVSFLLIFCFGHFFRLYPARHLHFSVVPYRVALYNLIEVLIIKPAYKYNCGRTTEVAMDCSVRPT